MYTIRPAFGTVVRDSDGKVVAPCDSVEDPDFQAYQAWVAAGNQPTVDLIEPVLVPLTITSRQMRLALNKLGLRSAVEAAVAASAQDVKDQWEYSTEFERYNSLVIQFGQMLNADLDALFILGASFNGT